MTSPHLPQSWKVDLDMKTTLEVDSVTENVICNLEAMLLKIKSVEGSEIYFWLDMHNIMMIKRYLSSQNLKAAAVDL